ncbi:MAG: ligand-binding sensor domain-containing protein, partial [Flavisolibacter sp.]
MRQTFLLVFLSTAATFHLLAQNISEKNFDYYSTGSGMSHNSINGITQDKTGYIWLATVSGLNRFDGTRFVQFHSNNDSLSITAENLKGMAWLDKYRLAVLSSGLHIIDTRTGERQNLFIPYHDLQFKYKFNIIERVLGDEAGNVYVLSRSGFYHFDKNYNLLSRFDYYSDAKVPLAHFYFGRELFELDNERLLIISINGLYIYDKKNRMVNKMSAEDCPILAEYLSYPKPYYTFFQHKPGSFFILKQNSDSLAYINTLENKKTISRLPFNPGNNEFHWRSRLFAAKNNMFYVTGHNSGFYKMLFDPESGKLKFYNEKYFTSYMCTSLLEDKEQNLWVGTNRGLFRQNPQRAQVQIAELPKGLEESYPNLMLDDVFVTENKIYAGSTQGGLFVFDKNSFQYKEQILLKNKNIYSN